MKSAKQNTIRQSIGRHRITLITSQNKGSLLFISTKQRTRRADDGYKKNRPIARHRIVQELCESRGGRPGLSVLTSLLVSADVKNY